MAAFLLAPTVQEDVVTKISNVWDCADLAANHLIERCRLDPFGLGVAGEGVHSALRIRRQPPAPV